MGKGIYVGVGGKARKVKKIYVGVETQVPIYNETSQTANISTSNIATYFTVTNGSYYFAGSGSTFTTNNGGTSNSTASTVLTALHDITALSFSYSYSSEANYDKFTLKVGGTTVENAVSGTTTTKNYSGSLAKGQKIEFTYTKDGSQNGNDDRCQFSAMSITVTIKEEVGQETKEYARKVKKAYIGVGGVARPCFSSGGVEYYGTISPLTYSLKCPAAASVGDYAIFYGGRSNSDEVLADTTMDAYASNLTKTSSRVDYYGYEGITGISNGAYAIFAGGYRQMDSWSSSSVKAYNASLTKQTLTSLQDERSNIGAALVGDYALFAGGTYYTDNLYKNSVDAYNSSLVHSTTTSLNAIASSLVGATAGNYALFGSGYRDNAGSPQDVYVYDNNLVRGTKLQLSSNRSGASATTLNNCALFGGGSGSEIVDIFNSSLVLQTPQSLSQGRSNLAAVTLGDYALFGGGYKSTSPSGAANVVDCFDLTFSRQEPSELSTGREYLSAATTGNYALFGGGNPSNIVDAYTIN